MATVLVDLGAGLKNDGIFCESSIDVNNDQVTQDSTMVTKVV